jgi:hypothetical protein
VHEPHCLNPIILFCRTKTEARPLTRAGYLDRCEQSSRKPMNFTIKYRNSNGKLTECKIQAIDRRDCITKCRNQGIIPIEIFPQTQTSENKKSADSSKILTKYNLSVWSLAISVVFLTIICLYFISAYNFTFQPNTPKNEKRRNSKSSLRNFSKSTNNIQQCTTDGE